MRTFAAIMLAATLGLGQSQPPDAGERSREVLERAAKDRNPDVRKEAVVAVSLVGAKEKILEYLDSMLTDPDIPVRVAVVSTLSEFKDKRTVPLLKKALEDPIAEVAFAAGKALYDLKEPEGRQFLISVAFGESKGSSSYLSSEGRSYLRMLRTPTKLFITAAGMTVPVPGFGLGLSSVQGILSDPGSSARAAALLLLARDNDPAVESATRAGLSDKEWSVRAAAVQVTAMHPYPQFRQDLVGLLNDQNNAVRFRAAAAYMRLQRLPK
jgi:HEAT repeat protein